MDTFVRERDKCIEVWLRDLVDFPKIFSAMVGAGNWELALVVWAFILFPICLLAGC
jgi:hypothetical protein